MRERDIEKGKRDFIERERDGKREKEMNREGEGERCKEGEKREGETGTGRDVDRQT